jgi:serine/threonine protein kinase
VLGQRVNNFEIVRLLGEGGMGSVYEADHLLMRKKVAVKVLRRELSPDPDLVQRFFNEARATSAIRHPNIVEVIDLGLLQDGVPYLVMELLEGETLSARLERLGSLPIASAVDFVRQTASALGAAHANGIIHRDLKPENLFLTPDPRFHGRELVKVLDFGIAKLRVDPSSRPVTTLVGAVLGTPAYMSPEQCRGVEVDHRSDIYALGVILYELLCGTPPFLGEAVGDVLMMHMSVDPVPPSTLRAEVPSQLDQAILKALAKHRDRRFLRVADFAEALGPKPSPRLALGSGELPSEDEPSSRDSDVDGTVSGAATKSREPPLTMPPELEPASQGRKTPLGPLPRLLEGKHDATLPSAPSRASKPEDAKPRDRLSPRVLRAGASLATLGLLVLALTMSVKRQAGKTGPETASSTQRSAAVPVVPPTAPGALPRERMGSPMVSPNTAAGPVVDGAPQAPDPRTRSRSVADQGARRASTTKPAAPLVNLPASTTAPSAPAPRPGSPAPSVALGYLSLDSSPWAEVFLAGELLGSTPLQRVPLPPGKHVLALKNPELHTSASYVVEIKPGQTVSRFVGWGKE